MTNKSILSKIYQMEEQLARVSERLYQPQLSSSDYRELTKKKKKIDKELEKLKNKLENCHEQKN
jgi:hypothetical protein